MVLLVTSKIYHRVSSYIQVRKNNVNDIDYTVAKVKKIVMARQSIVKWCRHALKCRDQESKLYR